MFNNKFGLTTLFLFGSLLFIATTDAAQNDWAEGTRLERDGATRDYYNRAAYLKWKNYMGDWRDADKVAQGNKPYAVADVVDLDKGRFVERRFP